MARLVFWDVATLYDFMRSDGKLHVPASEEIIPALEALTGFAHAHRIPIVASADNHEATDAEISDVPDWKATFPPHWTSRAAARSYATRHSCDPRHSDRFSAPYLAVLVGVSPTGTMRDARDKP